MAERTIVNPIVQDQVTFIKTQQETQGACTWIRAELGSKGGSQMHYHDKFTETFIVNKGPLSLHMEKEVLLLKAGEKISVPINTLHKFYNPNDFAIEFEVKIEPGSRNFEEFLQIMYGLAADGKTNKKGVPKGLLTIGAISQLGETLPARGSVLHLLGGLLRYLGKRAEKKGILAELRDSYVRY